MGCLAVAGWFAPSGGLSSSDVSRDAHVWLSPWLGAWAAANAAGHCCLRPWLSLFTLGGSLVFATTRLCLWALEESEAGRAAGYLCATVALAVLFYAKLEWHAGFVLSCLVSNGLVFRELAGEGYTDMALFALGVLAVPCLVWAWPRATQCPVETERCIETEPCIATGVIL